MAYWPTLDTDEDIYRYQHGGFEPDRDDSQDYDDQAERQAGPTRADFEIQNILARRAK